MAVSDWQTTADDNTDVDGVDISKGFPARNVGSAFRNIMADTKAEFDKKQAELDKKQAEFEAELNKGSFCGEIRQFYGTLDSDGHPIPLDWAEKGITTGLTNWHVCDGSAGTPDMRGRVAVGMTDSNTLGEALGSDTVTPTITIGATAQQTSLSATTLSVAQLASHSHTLNGGAFIGNGSGGNYNGSVQWATSGFWAYNETAYTGSNRSHSHGISNPAHGHTAQSTSIKLLPPAKALHYIMRCA